MAAQANYDALVTALAANSESGISDSGGKLLEELRNGDPLPTGGVLVPTGALDRGGTNLVRGINSFLD